MKTSPASTRDALLESAVTLIREADSSADVTVRHIVDRAGANLNAVNYHFGSKVDLVREAVRVVIGDYFRARGTTPGSTGHGLLANMVRICDFLFDEPVAARLALRSELDADGAGQSLTSETMAAFLELLRQADPELPAEEARFRVWTMTAVIHQCVLRPGGCAAWLGIDLRDKPERDLLLARLCDLTGLPDAP